MRWDTYLCRHNQASRGWIDSNISCHEADVAKLGQHLAILLITESLCEAKRVDILAYTCMDSNSLTFIGLVYITRCLF